MPKASTFAALIASQVIDSDSIPIITNAGDNKLLPISEARNAIGPGWSATVNAYNEAGATNEIKIQAAIGRAVSIGADRVFVPTSMYPYDASLITFDGSIQMVREGGSFDVYDLRAYGATGDGVVDDTEAFQAALDSMQNTRGVMFIPPGHYSIDEISMPTPSYDGITVRGASMRGSRLNFTTTGTAITIGSHPGAVTSQIVFENLWISAPDTNIMCDMKNASQCTFSRLYIDESGNTGSESKGFSLYACMASLFSEVSYGGNVNAKYGWYIGDDSDGTTINHCYIKGEPTASSYSIVCDAGPTVAAHVNTVISDSIIGGASVASILVGVSADTALVQIRNNYFEGSEIAIELGNAASLFYARNILIEGNYFYIPGDHGIKLNATRRVRIMDNFFFGGGGFDIFFHATATNNSGIIALNNTPQDATFHISIPANHQSYYEDGDGILHDRLGRLVNSDFWNPGSIAVGGSLTKTTTVTGAALGDRAEVTTNLDLAGLTMTSYVSAADTVTHVLANNTAGAVDLGIFDIYVKVGKY